MPDINTLRALLLMVCNVLAPIVKWSSSTKDDAALAWFKALVESDQFENIFTFASTVLLLLKSAPKAAASGGGVGAAAPNFQAAAQQALTEMANKSD